MYPVHDMLHDYMTCTCYMLESMKRPVAGCSRHLSNNAAHRESAAFLASYADAVARQNPFEGHAIAPVRERWRR